MANPSKHRVPNILELQTWALGQIERGHTGMCAIYTAANIWRELGHPEFAEAILSVLD